MKITDLKNYTVLPSSTSIPKKSTQPKGDTGLKGFATGVGKGVAQTFQGLGQLGLKGVKAVTGKDYGTEATLFNDPYALEAKTGAEKLGKFTEQVAEFAIPGSKVSKATQGMKFIPKIASRATTSGAIATAQQGEIGEDTATAAGIEAAIPVAGKIISPATKFLGTLLKGTGSGLSGAPSEAIEQIYKNPKIALKTAQEIKKSKSADILRKNALTVREGVSKIKQEARGAYGKGLEQLSRVDIEPTTFRKNIQSVLDESGVVLENGTRKLKNVEFSDPKNIKKASELVKRLSNADLDGKSLRKLADDIENSAFRTATSDERLAFNVFVRDLSNGLKRSISSSTNKLDEINKQFSGDMQLAEAVEDILGDVKYTNNLGEINKTAKKLESLFTEKGLDPSTVDTFLEKIGISSGNFKATEAMRQVSDKSFTANTVGTSPFEVLRAFTSAVVSPKMVGKIAAYTGLGEDIVKEMSEKLSPTARGAIIKLLTGNPKE